MGGGGDYVLGMSVIVDIGRSWVGRGGSIKEGGTDKSMSEVELEVWEGK